MPSTNNGANIKKMHTNEILYSLMKEIDRYNDQHVRQKLFDQPEGNKVDGTHKSTFSSPQKADFTGIILSESPVKSLRGNYPHSEKKASKSWFLYLSNIIATNSASVNIDQVNLRKNPVYSSKNSSTFINNKILGLDLKK